MAGNVSDLPFFSFQASRCSSPLEGDLVSTRGRLRSHPASQWTRRAGSACLVPTPQESHPRTCKHVFWGGRGGRRGAPDGAGAQMREWVTSRNLGRRQWLGWPPWGGPPSILHQRRLRWGCPRGTFHRSPRASGSLQKDPNFSGQPAAAPAPALPSPAGLLARPLLRQVSISWQGGQRLKGKPAGL